MTAPAILMAAPNGARRGKADHPALPGTIPEIVAEARACRAAGAALLHAHVRDATGAHVLDAGLYAELLAECARAVPDLLVQVTTEAAGRYGPEAQAALIETLRPPMLSIALREIWPEGSNPALAARSFALSAEAGLHVQHILYDAADLARFRAARAAGVIPAAVADCVLFVLGRYAEGQRADPAELAPFLAPPPQETWFLCAFGPAEGACIRAALSEGGHARVGFENNLHLADGTLAPSTAALVAEAAKGARALGREIASPAVTARLLGLSRPLDASGPRP
ncbi:MAG: 3-keto-5-aminohexanoate cleavage protein [Rhodobacteraceae bacterium]|nr:3-keto-5-aminohexanoate cleavage protein [Paracoccaceae bacterium]